MERAKYRRDSAGVSTFLLAILTPVAIWGMLSAILMQLIEIRLMVIEGGESKLMVATLAFAAGIILCQRLVYYQGPLSFIIYAVGLGTAITGFSLSHAIVYRTLGIHPFFVFIINDGIYALLWWATHHLVKACAMDPDERTIGSGILVWNWRKALPEPVVREQAEEEKQWTEHMPRKHPGRLIVWIAMGAIPLFGLINFLTASDDLSVQQRLAFEITLFIVSVTALLCLLALGQFRLYLEKRKASLPEVVGLSWLATGAVTLSVILYAAFALPQPPGAAGFVIRNAINGLGIPISAGFVEERDSGQRPGRASEQGGVSSQNTSSDGRAQGNENSASTTALDRAASRAPSIVGIFSSFLYGVLVTLFIFLSLSMVFIFFTSLVFLFGGIVERLGKAGKIFWQWTLRIVLRVRWESAGKENKPKKDFAVVVPFSDSFRDAGSVALVRYAWESLLQYCGQQGDPCEPSMTPREFLQKHPASLRGFERQALALADLYTFSEFSDRPLPESAEGELRGYWNAFLAFSRAAGGRGQSFSNQNQH